MEFSKIWVNTFSSPIVEKFHTFFSILTAALNVKIVVGGMKGYIYDNHIDTVDIYFDFQTTTEILNVGSNEGWFKGM